MWTLYLSAFFLSVVQIQHVLSTGCGIVSMSSPSASSLDVVWSPYSGATYYQLDLRIVNSTTTAPVIVTITASYTQKQIQGLSPGTVYQVTLNVFVFFSIACTAVDTTTTVPDKPQIISAEAISSSAVNFEWSNEAGVVNYLLFVEVFDSPSTKYNKTFTGLTGQMNGLERTTTYNCYIYAINSAGSSDSSSTKTVMTLEQPPAEANVTSTGKSTVDVTWTPVTDVLLYAVTVTDADNPSNAPVTKNTSGTSMDISNLEPCSTYTIGVSSYNIFLVPGEPITVSYTTSNINPVTTVSTDYSCADSSVTVSWNLVFGANSYKAVVVDGTGASLNCTSASTSCTIAMISCGETYQVEVAGISDDCTSTSSTGTTFETTPCAPANVKTDHTCSTNVIIFSWDHTNRTTSYEAKSVDKNGMETTCWTVDNQCYFTNAECGQVYTFTVFAMTSECNSDVSQTKTVQTSPCQPGNVKTSYQCLADKLVTAWDSAEGADVYTVATLGNTDETYSCNTTSNSCEITGVPCGEHLSIWITASNEMCTTPAQLADIAQTAPCTPQNASASVDCSQDSARVNWTTSLGSIYYIVIAQESNGNIHGCLSMGSHCLIEALTCGNNYTVTVIATNIECNSTNNEELTFTTAPCAPANVQALRSCDENSARIEWTNHQPTGLYTTTIEDQSGTQLTCTNDTVNYCTFSALPCGMTYSVTVAYSEENCVSTSTPISMDSVPCGPEDLIASVVCDTEELTLTWNMSLPADNFTAVITGEAGHTLQCNSTGTQCTTGGLLCGSSYGVTVSSTTGMCSSLPSTEVTVQTWPCPPTIVTVAQTCSSAPVAVSWAASDSAEYHTAVATSSGGHSTNCSTNQTSCSLAGLQCGEVYSVGVSGADSNCTGPLSNTVSLDTEPCTPSNVYSQLMCDDAIAHVFWSPTANAVSYNVTATSDGQILTCSSYSSNCTLSNLVCDQAYDIQVTATDGMCVSDFSAAFSQDPVPCPPQNISTNPICGTNDLSVSWVPSSNAFNYTVTALPLTGSAVTYYTSSASYTLSGLQCGGTYDVTIKASSDNCSGAYSSPQTVQTAPCPPQSLTAEALCGTNSLLASWNTSLGATTYTASVTGPNGFSDNCSSSSVSCSVFGLQCSSQYNVSLTSQDGYCTSAPIETVLTTEPCDPVTVTSSLHCGSDMATVSWVASAGAVAYTVVVQDTSGQSSTSYTSSTTSCQLSQLQCGTVYNLTVAAGDGSCNSTGNTEAVLMTAPCSPSIHNSTNICGTSSSSLSWESMAHAVGYTVNATATSGHQVSCNPATATCTLTNLECSETYTATVVARGSQCDSPPGPSFNFSTEPCSPSVISKQYTCDTSTAEFSWTNPAGSLSFVAHVAGEGYQDNCHTTNTGCVFHNLPCDLCFNITVQAQGPQCNSTTSASESMETVPCIPQNVSATLGCLNHSASVTWAGSPSAIGYNVTLTSQDGHTHHSHTYTSSCDVPDIHCGETYSITVTPYSMTCPGNQSAAYSFSSGLCAPTTVSVSPDCEDNTVSWSLVAGAEMYLATASADDGHNHTCSSNSFNTCNFTDLHCGETYSVTVQTVDRGCYSQPSSAAVLTTAPCLPENVTADVECNTNVMTVSWAQTTGSDDYTASAISADGHSGSCNSTCNSCSISDLQCGKVYEVSVTPSTSQCSSTAGSDYMVQAAPCKPENTTAEQSCGSNNVTVTWSECNAVQNYNVTASPASGANSTCVSTGSSCCFPDLSCGQLYTFTVMGHTDVCMSEMSTPIEKMTGPCAPTSVSADMNCTTHEAVVSWSSAAGADAYNVQANSTNGHSSSCSAAGTSCNLGSLVCGEQYSVVVEPLDTGCPGPVSSPAMFTTEPCVPTILSVNYNASTAEMTWATASGADSYSVEAVTDQGSLVTCDTSNTSYLLTGLQCSQVYNVTVMAHNQACNSSMSGTHQVLTEPCPPTNVQADIACESLTVTVSWDQSALAVGYVAYVDNQSGHCTSCAATTNTQCTVSGLTCGTVYNVWVKALGQEYNSSDSTVVSLTSGPCQPSSIGAVMDCDALSATISWQLGVGAVSYAAELTATSGHTAGCTTNHTDCEPSSLQCGEEYNVTVMALGETCNSSAQMAGHLTTEPCVPTNLNVHYNSTTAQVTWSAASGASYYCVEATTDQGPLVLCNTTTTSCVLSGLQCSRVYNVTVMAQNWACNNTVTSESDRVMTEPCPPTNVQANMVCEQLTATVSWDQSALAVGYVAYVDNQSGHYTSCAATTNTQCTVSGLTCGTVYNVWVKALGQEYNSSDSTVVSLTSAPCLPGDIVSEVNCNTDGAATVSWNTTSGAANFSLTAFVSGSRQTLCMTQQNSCNVTNLPCGQTYYLNITACNEECSITAMMPTNVTTRPCPPNGVTVDLECGSSTADLSWMETSDVELYKATAIKASGGVMKKCNSTGSTCQFPSLVCGETYNFTVTAHGQGCCSQASSTVFIQTEPCVPTILSVNYNASTSEVTWATASGADSYSVEAVSDQGSLVTCDTSNTSYLLTGLQCSQVYNVTVMAHNQACNSSMSGTHQVLTEPCPPTNVQADIACESLTVTVSWDQSALAVGYVAYVDNQSGHCTSCAATTNTQCTVSGLTCGTVYNVWVKALGQEYNSSDSTVVSLTSGPCQPSSIGAVMDCDALSATISWQLGVGAVSYAAELTATSGHTAGCTTNHTDCEPSSLQCGEEYNVTVMALGETCNSSAQMAGHLTTEPCVPTNLNVHYNSTTAQVTWSAASGASYYCVEATTDQGPLVLCNTTTTSCVLSGLQCSRVYNVTVMAQNWACNNTVTSESDRVMTEPCPPTNVQANMVCEQLTATVSWDQSALAVGYVAYVDNQSGHYTSCAATTNTQCTVSGLTCGTVYNVWVKALGQEYNSSDSTVASLTSAPCLPGDIVSEVNCNTDGAATVSWNTTSGAANFSLTAFVSGSRQTLCMTQQNSCNVTNLPCGQTYYLNITACNEECSITAMMPTNVTTRPCPPNGVTVDLECGSSTADLSWMETSDVELYKATAIKASGGVMKKCNSTGSTCQFPSLVCGETYNFTVTAHGQGCCSQASSTVFIQTEPCVPTILSVNYNASTSEVTWATASGADSYSVEAVSDQGSLVTCDTSNTSYLLTGLQCSQVYNVTVMAHNQACNSSMSGTHQVLTEPCPPTNVQADIACESLTVTVSWDQSALAVGYVAYVDNQSGHCTSCAATTNTQCTVSGLTCGTVYNVWVKALGQEYNSSDSTVVSLTSGPCQPVITSVQTHCQSEEVQISWGQTSGVVNYTIRVKGNLECVKDYNTTDTLLSVTLPCGQNYNVTVQGQGYVCESVPSSLAFFKTGPCVPQNVTTDMQCELNTGSVSWGSSDGAESYVAEATGLDGHDHQCFSNTTSCTWDDLHCGESYTVVVRAKYDNCTSLPSSSSVICMDPCVPENLSASADCDTKVVSLTWGASNGSETYYVKAESENTMTQLMTNVTTADFTNLTCGQDYNLTVTPHSNHCAGSSSERAYIQTWPCAPSGISVYHNCPSHFAVVSWQAGDGSDSYTLSLQSDSGVSTTATSVANELNVTGLDCGHNFSVSVTASNQQCNSTSSENTFLQSAPCQPQGISGDIDCVTNSARISWSAALGADSYTVTAVGGADYTANCSTCSNTTCEVEDLACGVHYDFQVTAQNSQCESQPSATIDLHTGPCQPTGVSVAFHCNNESAELSWMSAMNAAEYYGCAQSETGDMLYCYSTSLSCTFEGLDCGELYNFTVQASDGTCNSSFSDPVQQGAVPCPPDAFEVLVLPPQTADQALLFSWDQVSCNDSWYLVTVTGNLLGDGQALFEILSYWTKSLYFEIPLPCGSFYNATVQSKNDAGTSDPSETLSGPTAPCPPAYSMHMPIGPMTHLHWTASAHASEYTVYDNSVTPRIQMCRVSGQSCFLTNITSSNLVVTASNAAGESTEAPIS